MGTEKVQSLMRIAAVSAKREMRGLLVRRYRELASMSIIQQSNLTISTAADVELMEAMHGP